MSLALKHTSPPDSPLARWDSRWKLAAIAFLILGTASVHGTPAAGAFFALAVGLALLGRIPRRAILGRIGLVLFAVVPVLVIVPFTVEDGFDSALGVGFRALAIGTFAMVLVHTAPLHHTLAAAHRLRVPGVLVQVTQLAYRYTFLLSSEARRTRTALRTRGFRPRTDAHTYRTTGQAVGGLLVRGGERADRVSAAMRCRGFDGTFHTLTAFRTTAADVLGFLVAVSFAVGLLVADRYF